MLTARCGVSETSTVSSAFDLVSVLDRDNVAGADFAPRRWR